MDGFVMQAPQKPAQKRTFTYSPANNCSKAKLFVVTKQFRSIPVPVAVEPSAPPGRKSNTAAGS